MDDSNKYGLLLNQNAKLQRQYFREAVKLLGIKVLYRAPLPNKHYTTYAEIDSNYQPPILVGCLFDEYPKQPTTRKKGWMVELQDGSSLINVDYDLPDLQVSALFIIPSGIECAKGRLFRVVRMWNDFIYPSSIACEIVPEYENTVDEMAITDFSHQSFTFINQEDDPTYKR